MEQLRSEFIVSGDPSETMVVYRGDKLGREQEGMPASVDRETALWCIEHALNEGRGAINYFIQEHVNAWEDRSTPFISTTTDLRRAHQFARRNDETIYRLEVPTQLLVRDADNLGARDNIHELLLIGGADVEMITACKLNPHEPSASEMRYTRSDGFISEHTALSLNLTVGDAHTTPNPNGVWQDLR